MLDEIEEGENLSREWMAIEVAICGANFEATSTLLASRCKRS